MKNREIELYRVFFVIIVVFVHSWLGSPDPENFSSFVVVIWQ